MSKDDLPDVRSGNHGKFRTYYGDLVVRLVTELYDGRGKCASRRISSIVNVVAGDEESEAAGIAVSLSPGELIQTRMGIILKNAQDHGEPGSAAYNDFAAKETIKELEAIGIPKEDWYPWIEPFKNEE